ncbi:MAG: hypothetical protein OI74_07900 [Gammaproteobacteria bacterium (ex Lamellibrachia satsuma)]|nr:MAG: hypothetical protein OI74_07900 [Gammaproteobacteria bacterium (ex Lamellibrachia satsuma)]RRS35044.1 MAG: hypothetical protein NV67_11530 [Gammaproteobacteria bacterium (ex Lamellibrachia satsuma)]
MLWDNPEFGPINLAIDIPSGFPDAFIQLLTQGKTAASIEAFNTIPTWSAERSMERVCTN